MEHRGRVLHLLDAEQGHGDALAVDDPALGRAEVEEGESERGDAVLEHVGAEIREPRRRAALDLAAEAQPERPPRIVRAVVLEAAGVVEELDLAEGHRGTVQGEDRRVDKHLDSSLDRRWAALGAGKEPGPD